MSKRRLRIKNANIDNYDPEEFTYYKNLPLDEKLEIADAENRLAELNNTSVPFRFRILKSPIDDKIKHIAVSKLDELSSMCSSSGEYHKINRFVQNMTRIPFGKYKSLPLNKDNREEVRSFILGIKNSLDDEVYGHKDAKDQVVRLLAQWISNPLSKGLVIGIQGAMGTGKTTLIKDAICKVLGIPFAFIPLGGISDGSYLIGHGYTYEGSTWGKIVDVLMKCQCMNPVFFFDELDKVSCTQHGEEIINILIHMTDATQNSQFHDKYFSNLEFDLSRSLIIFSYNDESNIHPVLKDRMVRIKTSGYKKEDKIAICEQHMIHAVLKEFGFEKDRIVFSREILSNIIEDIEQEQGVRNLRRAIHDIVSNINLEYLVEEHGQEESKSIIVTDKHLKKYLLKSKEDNISLKMMYM